MDILIGSEVNLPFEAVRIAIAIIGVAACAYYDIFNKKNVPQLLLNAFLALSVIVAVIAYDPIATPYGLVAGAIVFAANYLLYKTGYLGGADVFILAAITILLPSQPTMLLIEKSSAVLAFPFIIHVLTAAFLTFMIHLIAKTMPHVVMAVKKGNAIKPEQWFGAFAILISYGFLAYIITTSPIPIFSSSYMLFLAALAAISVYFVLFRNVINDSMIEWLPAKKVEVEDIIAPDKMDAALVKKYAIGRLVDKEQLKRLSNIKEKIPVYKHLLPFVPHLLIGLIISLLFGNILLVISWGGA